MGENRAARVAYDDGNLEIMTPLPEHEQYKEVISDAVKDIAEKLDLNYESLGSTTWKRERKMAGIEADNCFYFQNEPLVRGRLDLDLQKDPPPDLALEIDVSNKSLNRFPIYARLEVPEIWCYDSGELTIYSSSRSYEVQILIIKLLWCGHLARTRCTSLKATCCIFCNLVNIWNLREV
ncbi:hypothetical protein NIES80_18960 [Dolichospermum planctonicum]|uniref:Putative restriction endonuclease domain-containing protein n=1 Tax=Dolichospermum planctonicum TaxID=136072 RepID=A0A480AEM0_9CYAN|nr:MULTISPECIES: Uma2 family endonuclease [Nostocales]GCL42193.1 hypothetical protein NIES80_18960 [Dolichospermum planctonicum]